MKKSAATITFLIVTLLTTNGWWLYQAIDAGVTATYQDVVRRENVGALDQVLAIVPFACSADRDGVIEAATPEHFKSKPFYKDGYVWVENIGLAFGPTGHLEHVVKAWQHDI